MKPKTDIGISGRVEIFNKTTGEKIWENSNMITNGGRQIFSMLVSANWDSQEVYNTMKEYSPKFLRLGATPWEGSSLNPDVKSLKDPKDTYIPYTNVFRSYDLAQQSNSTSQLGGNSLIYQFDYVNLSKDPLNIKELGLFSKNENLLAYEPISGTMVSADIEMTLVIKWIITFK